MDDDGYVTIVGRKKVHTTVWTEFPSHCLIDHMFTVWTSIGYGHSWWRKFVPY